MVEQPAPRKADDSSRAAPHALSSSRAPPAHGHHPVGPHWPALIRWQLSKPRLTFEHPCIHRGSGEASHPTNSARGKLCVSSDGLGGSGSSDYGLVALSKPLPHSQSDSSFMGCDNDTL